MRRPRFQIEFVVDNACVAGLANSTIAVKNDFFDPCVRRIRKRIVQIFHDHCSYKAGFLEPVDWRAREWNAGADYLANHALRHKMVIYIFLR